MPRTIDMSRTMWMHFVTPLTVLTLYLVSFSFFFSWLLPGNVNAVFVDRAWKFVLTAAGVSYLLLFILLRKAQGHELRLGDSVEKVRAIDSILLLLPLAPVVQYILSNQDILSPLGSLYVLGVFGVFCVLFVIVIPTLLGVVGSTKTLMILGMAFTFMITNMASLSAQYAWFEEGSLRIQFAVFSAILVVGWCLYHNRIGKKLLYVFVVAFFIGGIAFQSAAEDPDGTVPAGMNGDNSLVELVGSRKPPSTPNIYLLVYESYVTNETMLAYGIDNSAQEEYLQELGFKLYPRAYSVGGASIGTMSRVFNACTEYYGATRRGVSGDGIVQNLLKSLGYETYGVFKSDYFFRGVGSHYDYSLPEAKGVPSAHGLLVTAVFMGEFRFDVDVEFDSPSHEQFLEHKEATFESVPEDPRFVYMHDPFPGHSQNSGVCLPNETELYADGLFTANSRMKHDIGMLLQSDPDSIIIVAGDHGPYLTKNCTKTGRHYDISQISRLDIQDRFGTFLAVRWPTEGFSQYDDITVLQDLFPVVFAYLFEDDEFLAAKVEPNTLEASRISGAQVRDGIIHGGINDGEPLFVGP